MHALNYTDEKRSVYLVKIKSLRYVCKSAIITIVADVL